MKSGGDDIVPLHPLPVIEEPYHKIAFVGLFPRSKERFKYVLKPFSFTLSLSR